MNLRFVREYFAKKNKVFRLEEKYKPIESIFVNISIDDLKVVSHARKHVGSD